MKFQNFGNWRSLLIPLINNGEVASAAGGVGCLHLLRNNLFKRHSQWTKRMASNDATNTSTVLKNGTKSSEDIDLSQKLAFLSRPNPVTGKMEWVSVDREDYDYIQEIARSGYGDMLHDTDRNKKYYAAINKVVKSMKARGQEVKVLDIGTGTGLLSMMGGASGADSITACEAFTPMAKCAKKVLATNGFGDKVKLIPKRSTDVLLGEDLTERANLLVTELFDTELIGEGAIPSYTDAHDRLMQDECVAVPTLGIMYVQPVHCPLLRQWNGLQKIELPNGSVISIPSEFDRCSGAPSLHDLQVDQLQDELKPLSHPVEVFRFDFSKKKALNKRGESSNCVSALSDGSVDAFVMWWDLDMEPTGEIVLSCAPCWTRKPGEEVPWRDHWMQAVYYPSSPLSVLKDSTFDIYSNHDEYSLWFDTIQPESSHPVCSCGLHVTMSRNRLAQMNNAGRNDIFTSVLQKFASPSKTCLVISDGSMLALIAAKLGFKKVFCLDNNPTTRRIIQQISDCNGLQQQISFLKDDVEKLTQDDFDGLKVDVVIAEPYFQGVHLPWQHLYFWYAVSSLRAHLDPNVVILPERMAVKALAVQFDDLHKIRAPVGICEGFDLSHFDQLIESSSNTVDEEIEPQPLWEYPCRSLSSVGQLMSLDFTKPVDSLKTLHQQTAVECMRPGAMNGMALWTEYTFDCKHILLCGPTEPMTVGDNPKWDKTNRQGVYLFRHSKQWQTGDSLTVDSSFDPSTGDFTFKFL